VVIDGLQVVESAIVVAELLGLQLTVVDTVDPVIVVIKPLRVGCAPPWIRHWCTVYKLQI